MSTATDPDPFIDSSYYPETDRLTVDTFPEEQLPEGYTDPSRPRFARLSMPKRPPWLSRIPAEHDAAGTLEDK